MCRKIKARSFRSHIWTSGVALPFNWEFLAFQGKSLKSSTKYYLYSPTYDLIFSVPNGPKASAKFNLTLNIIIFYNYNQNPSYSLFWKHLKRVLYSTSHRYALRVIFKGKGYYLYRNKRNTLTPQFGFAHRLLYYAYSTKIVFLRKAKFLFTSSFREDIVKTGYGLIDFRPINIFTGRGVRFRRQTVYKKAGKISTYI
jgi:hypothetical protein